MSDWKFDKSIAKIFDVHARQHIPHYDSVLKKTLDVCSKVLEKSDPIIDVGCATGNTLDLLSQWGFTNLYGIDSSIEMLEQCAPGSNLICSDKFVFESNTFQAVICNWTLHFIEYKIQYLKSMVDSLRSGGVLIITDKISLDPLMIEFYHDFKREQGVTDQDILSKEKSVAGIMNIDDQAWYQKQFLDLGLTYYVIDADYAFMTFLCFKQ